MLMYVLVADGGAQPPVTAPLQPMNLNVGKWVVSEQVCLANTRLS